MPEIVAFILSQSRDDYENKETQAEKTCRQTFGQGHRILGCSAEIIKNLPASSFAVGYLQS